MSLIYVAHPIDTAGSMVSNLCNQALTHLVRANNGLESEVLYLPSRAFHLDGKNPPMRDGSILAINTAALDQADGLLVLWPNDSKSWGVPAEVERALARGIPVHMVTQGQTLTWAVPVEDVNVFKQHPGGNFEGVAYSAYAALKAVIRSKGKNTGAADEERYPRAVTLANLGPLVRGYGYDPSGPLVEGKEMDHPAASADEARRVLPWADVSGEPMPLAQAPSRAYADDAGLDLYVFGDHTIAPHSFQDIPSGVAVQMPSDVWGMLAGRSSTLRKKGLLVNQGIIDPGYRGELYAGVWNMTNEPVTIKHGERVAQLILLPNTTSQFDPRIVVSLESSERGSSGFGSSGA